MIHLRQHMSNTINACVSHDRITDATVSVREANDTHQWDCTLGRWLLHTLLLALPFAANVVRPDAMTPIWLCKPKRLMKGVRSESDLTGMPLEVPNLPEEQYRLRLLVGHMFDCTIVAGWQRPAPDHRSVVSACDEWPASSRPGCVPASRSC